MLLGQTPVIKMCFNVFYYQWPIKKSQQKKWKVQINRQVLLSKVSLNIFIFFSLIIYLFIYCSLMASNMEYIPDSRILPLLPSNRSFSHDITSFFFFSVVPVRRPVRVIKITFAQSASDRIFCRTWQSDSISLLNCSFGKKYLCSDRWWICCPIYSLTCQLLRQIRTSATAGAGFWELLQPVNMVRVHPLITMHLIRMQQTSTVSCDGRTGRLR